MRRYQDLLWAALNMQLPQMLFAQSHALTGPHLTPAVVLPVLLGSPSWTQGAWGSRDTSQVILLSVQAIRFTVGKALPLLHSLQSSHVKAAHRIRTQFSH